MHIEIIAFQKSNLCSILPYDIIYLVAGSATGNRVHAKLTHGREWLTFIQKRMEVLLMKKRYSFQDLMTFGMFLLTLLTFIYLICH